ncbi:MAG: glycosyltransferase [Litoreibacter sp.]|nr:glycosyltransferase [Litoreibacter sp.]
MNAPVTRFIHSAFELPETLQEPPKPSFGSFLVESRAISAAQLAEARRLQCHETVRLTDILLERGMIAPQDLMHALATYCDSRFVDLAQEPADQRLMELVDPRDCLDLGFVPWRLSGGALVLAITDMDRQVQVIRKLPPGLGKVRFVLAEQHAVHEAIHKANGARLIELAEKRTPEAYSCRNWSTSKMRALTALLCLAVFAGLVLWPAMVFTFFFGVALAVLLLNTSLKATCLLIALGRRRIQNSPTMFQHRTRADMPDILPKISILVPLFREEDIASALVRRLEQINYPRALLEICLVVEADDAVTRKALRVDTLPGWMRVIRVPLGALKTKPRAMNYALDFTTGTIIGVYDAEDAPDPGQLHQVARRFATAGPELVCLQGILGFYNTHTNWLSRCFAFEYAGWFRVMMPGLQKLGLALPLGGTTLFFRREALTELGAWDAHNVTEDADLGMRLARHGYRCEMMPTVTLEEANSRLWPWIRQRSRWLKGFAVTWRVHMRSPGRLLRDLGVRKFLGLQIVLFGAVAAFVLAPLLWWNLIAYLTGLPNPVADLIGKSWTGLLSSVFIASECISMSIYLMARSDLDQRPHPFWLLTMPVYFIFATVAALKGLLELLFIPFYWDKTPHGMFGGSGETPG